MYSDNITNHWYNFPKMHTAYLTNSIPSKNQLRLEFLRPGALTVLFANFYSIWSSNDKNSILQTMSRQHPWPHAIDNRILISMTVSEIWGNCQNLLDDPRKKCKNTMYKMIIYYRIKCFIFCLVRHSSAPILCFNRQHSDCVGVQ